MIYGLVGCGSSGNNSSATRTTPLTTWQRNGESILPNPDETYSTIVRDPAGGWRAYSHRVAGPAAGTIWMAHSADGLHWQDDREVFGPGPANTWDVGAVGVPFVWYEVGTARPWRMVYRGMPAPPTPRSKIGLATSVDGILWERKDTTGNVLKRPIIAPSQSWETGKYLDCGSVLKAGSTYYLHYDTLGPDRATGVATSTDLVHWNKDPGNPVFRSTRGPDVNGATIDSIHGRFCPDIVRWDDGVATRYVMFIPHYNPDLIHAPAPFFSDIEVYACATPLFQRAGRSFIGVVTTLGDDNQAVYDTPHIVCDTIERNVTGQTSVLMAVSVATRNPTLSHEELLSWHL